jgi:hypothetical protein
VATGSGKFAFFPSIFLLNLLSTTLCMQPDGNGTVLGQYTLNANIAKLLCTPSSSQCSYPGAKSQEK